MQHAENSNAMARELRVLRILERTPDLTQRQLVHKVGISLGGLNYFLKALMEKGFVKLRNLSMSWNKLGHAHVVFHKAWRRRPFLLFVSYLGKWRNMKHYGRRLQC